MPLHEAPGEAGRPTLRGRLNRISHYDVNVSDLERSRAWYEAVTALRVVAETAADQPFPSLGIERGRFRGCMMKDVTQDGGFPMIHLVQWEEPAPVGTPYLSQANVGWYRIVPLVEDIVAARGAVEAEGGKPFFPTTDDRAIFHPGTPGFKYRVFAVHDPDGITLEFGETMPGYMPVPKVPATVAHNTSNPDEFLSFYTETIGLDFLQGAQTPGPTPNVFSPLGGETELDGAFFGMRGDTRTFFDWLEWRETREYPTPYQEPTHLGIMRCVFEVDDVDDAHGLLRDTPWAREGRIRLSEPEEWHFGEQLGPRRTVTFSDPDGVGFQLVQQPTSPFAALHPFTGAGFPR